MRLLRRYPAFRALFVARCVSFAGDSISLVALMLHVADSTGQALAVAALLLAGDFTPSLLAPVAGALADRFDRRRLMITCELVQGVLIALIALSLPALPFLLVLVAVRAVAGQIFQPASRAAVPALVDDDDLERANATLGFGTNTAELIGPLLAAGLFPLLGIAGVLLLDAASFLLSALLLVALPRLPSTGQAATTSLWHDARAGLGHIATHRVVRVIAIGFFAVVAFTGVDDVALVVLATQTFDAGDPTAALLLGAIGIGLAGGYALLARVSARASRAAPPGAPGGGGSASSATALAKLFVLGLAVSSLGNLLTGLTPALGWAVVAAFTMQALRGLGIAAIDVASNTLLQRLVPDGMRGRVFGNLYGAIGIAAALSYVVGGLLLDVTSAPTVLVAAGVGGLIAALLTGAALRRALTRAPG